MPHVPGEYVKALDRLIVHLFTTTEDKKDLLISLIAQKRLKEIDTYLNDTKLRKAVNASVYWRKGVSPLSRLKPKLKTIFIRSIEDYGRVKAIYPKDFWPHLIAGAKEVSFKSGSFHRLTELLEANPPGDVYPVGEGVETEKTHMELRTLLFYNFLITVYGDRRFYLNKGARFQIDKGSLREGTEAAHHLNPVEYSHVNQASSLLVDDLKVAIWSLRGAARTGNRKEINDNKEILNGILCFFEKYRVALKRKSMRMISDDINAIINRVTRIPNHYVNDKKVVEEETEKLLEILEVPAEVQLPNDQNSLLKKLQTTLISQLKLIQKTHAKGVQIDIDEELVIGLLSRGVHGKEIEEMFLKAIDRKPADTIAEEFFADKFGDNPKYPDLFNERSLFYLFMQSTFKSKAVLNHADHVLEQALLKCFIAPSYRALSSSIRWNLLDGLLGIVNRVSMKSTSPYEGYQEFIKLCKTAIQRNLDDTTKMVALIDQVIDRTDRENALDALAKLDGESPYVSDLKFDMDSASNVQLETAKVKILEECQMLQSSLDGLDEKPRKKLSRQGLKGGSYENNYLPLHRQLLRSRTIDPVLLKRNFRGVRAEKLRGLDAEINKFEALKKAVAGLKKPFSSEMAKIRVNDFVKRSFQIFSCSQDLYGNKYETASPSISKKLGVFNSVMHQILGDVNRAKGLKKGVVKEFALAKKEFMRVPKAYQQLVILINNMQKSVHAKMQSGGVESAKIERDNMIRIMEKCRVILSDSEQLDGRFKGVFDHIYPFGTYVIEKTKEMIDRRMGLNVGSIQKPKGYKKIVSTLKDQFPVEAFKQVLGELKSANEEKVTVLESQVYGKILKNIMNTFKKPILGKKPDFLKVVDNRALRRLIAQKEANIKETDSSVYWEVSEQKIV